MEDLEDQIVKYLADNKDTWFPKAELTDKKQWQYEEAQKVKTAISDTISRKLRLAEEAKRIAKRKSGKSGEYRFLPLDKRATYIPFSKRDDDKKKILFRN